MASWFLPALLSLFSFGIWGLFSKLSIQYVDSKSALIYQSIGVITVGILVLCFMNFKLAVQPKGISFGLLTGFASCIGFFFYLLAADRGKISTVVTFTALYPVVTLILAFFILQETVNLKQCLGIGLALIAIFLMSY